MPVPWNGERYGQTALRRPTITRPATDQIRRTGGDSSVERRNVAGFLYGGASEVGAALLCDRSRRCPKHRRPPEAVANPGPLAALSPFSKSGRRPSTQPAGHIAGLECGNGIIG